MSGQTINEILIIRETIWRRKTEGVKITLKPPCLRSLPPTDEALELNIKRVSIRDWFGNRAVMEIHQTWTRVRY